MHPNPDLDRLRLSEDRLKKYGEQITKIRTWVIDRAKDSEEMVA